MPRKLTLDLDGLKLDSFDVSPVFAEARGTVEAREKVPCAWSAVLNSCPGTLHTCASFDVSCRAE